MGRHKMQHFSWKVFQLPGDVAEWVSFARAPEFSEISGSDVACFAEAARWNVFSVARSGQRNKRTTDGHLCEGRFSASTLFPPSTTTTSKGALRDSSLRPCEWQRVAPNLSSNGAVPPQLPRIGLMYPQSFLSNATVLPDLAGRHAFPLG